MKPGGGPCPNGAVSRNFSAEPAFQMPDQAYPNDTKSFMNKQGGHSGSGVFNIMKNNIFIP
jgi:hypothetical protein